MAAINGTPASNSVQGPQALSGPHFSRGPRGAQQANPSAASSTADQLDISPAAAQAADAAEGDIRTDRVNQIRAQIADGSYETTDKIDAAVSRLLDEIG